MSKKNSIPLNARTCFALYSTSLAMTKVYKPILKALKLTYPQYLVMLALWENDGLTVSSLGDALFLDSGTLTPLLKRLENSGYVKKTRSLSDERCVVVNLTAAGRALGNNSQNIDGHVVSASGCSAEYLGNLARQLVELRSSLLLSI